MRRLRVLLLCAALAGCGVPVSETPHRIAASDVPYGLASPTPPHAAPSTTAAAADDPRVYFVDEQDRLVARGRDVTAPTLSSRVAKLIADLAFGPTEQELADQLSTALPPEMELSVTNVEDGVVTVDFARAESAPSPEQSRRAVAQVVLTATSLPGVDAVLFTSSGEPVEAPLTSGQLTARPLTADDYASLVDPPQPR